eukprot:1178626-Lingulodinium_polyedra.AAC.1
MVDLRWATLVAGRAGRGAAWNARRPLENGRVVGIVPRCLGLAFARTSLKHALRLHKQLAMISGAMLCVDNDERSHG